MIQSAETRLEGNTLVVRIPMRFQRRGGRKRIVAQDGSELAPSSKPQPDGALFKAVARAHRWQRMLESGEHGTLAELAAAEQISRSYICRVLRLTLLAPDIVERILDGRPTAGLAQFLKTLPVEWEPQRKLLCGFSAGCSRAALFLTPARYLLGQGVSSPQTAAIVPNSKPQPDSTQWMLDNSPS